MEKNSVDDINLEVAQVPAETVSEEGVDDSLEQSSGYDMKMVVLVYLFLAAFGVGTGYLLSRTPGISVASKSSTQSVKVVKEGNVAGVTDTQTFTDSAEGVIEKGGLNGEGTHKLIRDGGPSQTAYLISSVIDLDEYVGKKVKVWGQTIAAKKAAWLMDVGKAEIE